MNAGGFDRGGPNVKNTFQGSAGQKASATVYSQISADIEEKVQKTSSSSQRKAYRNERTEKPGNEPKKDGDRSDISNSSYKRQVTLKKYEQHPHDGNINETLEEEAALISAHGKEIKDTMEIVREEMKLLAEVDQPGSQMENYVTQLSFVLSRKAANLVSLQARLARFQHRLREQEVLSRKRLPREGKI